MHLLSDLMKGKYVALKRIAEDRKEWQKLKRAEVIHLLLSRLLGEEEVRAYCWHNFWLVINCVTLRRHKVRKKWTMGSSSSWAFC